MLSIWSASTPSALCSKMIPQHMKCFFFFFNDTATTEIYTLSLHDALPIWCRPRRGGRSGRDGTSSPAASRGCCRRSRTRSEEHTSELQSPCNLVCRLLLEKKKRSTLASRSLLRRRPQQSCLITRCVVDYLA